MLKKTLCVLMTALMIFGLFAACGKQPAKPTANVSLNVVTTYGEKDGGRGAYESSYKAWQVATGNTVVDKSGTADEEFKKKVLKDFETGAEPDVLFYFNGSDSDPFVKNGKVIPIDQIKTYDAEFISNHNESAIPKSPVDGKAYAVPSTGIWEGLFVNKKVLDAAKVEVPGPDTTWDEFLAMCQKIKDAGYTPIAASLAQVPHYWFEYAILNNDPSVSKHIDIPEVKDGALTDSDALKAWEAGLADIKELYEKGFFPENTLTAEDSETMQLLFDDQAAFMIDGVWRVGTFETNYFNTISDFTVTFVPGKNNRKSTDIIAGLTSGWFITKKAWDDPEKRAAAVSFVRYMTSDFVISSFGAAGTYVSIKSALTSSGNPSVLRQDSVKMLQKLSNTANAVQDYLPASQRGILFKNIKPMVSGEITPEEIIKIALVDTQP